LKGITLLYRLYTRQESENLNNIPGENWTVGNPTYTGGELCGDGSPQYSTLLISDYSVYLYGK